MKGKDMKITQENILRSLMFDVVEVIREEASIYTQESKQGYDPSREDLVTSADKKAQALYVERIKINFPGFGIVGEEEGLNIEPAPSHLGKRFIIDPVDGTGAFARDQSHGVGSMLAMVVGDEVVSAYVSDINTGELFGYYGDGPVTRTRFGVEKPLVFDSVTSLSKQFALLLKPVHKYPSRIVEMVMETSLGGLCKEYEVSGGSIGILFSRLWKGEVGIMVTAPGYNTPWDCAPFVGINRKLGIIRIVVDQNTGEIVVRDLNVPLSVQKKNYFEVFVHESKAKEVLVLLREKSV